MPERNIIIRLQSVVGASVGRAFNAVNADIGEMEDGFKEARGEVARLTRQVKELTREGKDTSAVTRELGDAQQRAAHFRREVDRARRSMQRLNEAGERASKIGDALGKVSIATGLFSAALSFGLNEVVTQVTELNQAALRAGVAWEDAAGIAAAASRAGIKNAADFVEELKEIPRALQEALADAPKQLALDELGLDAERLLGLSQQERVLAISRALRDIDAERRQFLLEEAGLSGTIADQLLHISNLPAPAFQQFFEDIENGPRVTQAQSEAILELDRNIQSLKQELLLAGAAILEVYGPAIGQIIGQIAGAITTVAEFIAENRTLFVVLLSTAGAIAAVAVAYKAVAGAIALVKAAQTALAAVSVIGWSNPLIAAFAAIGLAVAGTIWLLRQFKSSADTAADARLPDTSGFAAQLSPGAVQAQADLFRREGNSLANELAAGSAGAPPRGTAATNAAFAHQAAPSTAVGRYGASYGGGGGGATQNFYINIDVQVTEADAGERIGNAVADGIQQKLQTSIYGHR